jgi:SAM-dependent methyltransferase
MEESKQRVRDFYDEVGWMQDADGLFQNARYEDLRPVSREYIRRCHLRVKRYLSSGGHILLDAGSGPVQWPEYLAYSRGYRYRLCVDISITALRAARGKLMQRGLYVVADIANLPFSANVFDGAVSMHAIHHLTSAEHRRAYAELHRVIRPGRTAVAVNGWYRPVLMRAAEPLITIGRWLSGRQAKRKKVWSETEAAEGTFVQKVTPSRLRAELRDTIPYEIHSWRSLSPRFMQWFIRPGFGGERLLGLIFRLEDMFPRFFGENGQYPLIVIRKAGPAAGDIAGTMPSDEQQGSRE